VSPHIHLDEELETIESPTSPAMYEVIVMRNITRLMSEGQITPEEFTHYCKRLYAAVDRRQGRAA
jgi:hypothetical protein